MAEADDDQLRRLTLREPRGYPPPWVTFENVPAFAVHLDAVIEVPELGRVTVDVGWGGMF